MSNQIKSVFIIYGILFISLHLARAVELLQEATNHPSTLKPKRK